MKEVKNKVTSINLDETTLAKYSHIIAMMVNRPLEAGFTTADMRRDFKILDKCEEAEDVISFTDEEFLYLKNKLSTMKFPIRHRDIIEFEDHINSI